MTFFVSSGTFYTFAVGSSADASGQRAGSFSEDRPLGWDPIAEGNRAMEWLATTVTAASGGNRELLLGPRPARCKRMRSSCWVPQPVFRVRGESYRHTGPSSLTAFPPYQTGLLRLPQHPCCQTPPARRLPWRHPALRPAPSAGQHPQRTGLCGRPTPSRP